MFLVIIAAIVATVASQARYNKSEQPEFAPIPYAFKYLSGTAAGSSSHEESGDGAGNIQGSYTVIHGYGLKRVVEYTAGPDGFKAIVRTNEPGTDNSRPDNVIFESTGRDAKGPSVMSSNSPVSVVRGGEQRQNVGYVISPRTGRRS